jgi:hypothetical protein
MSPRIHAEGGSVGQGQPLPLSHVLRVSDCYSTVQREILTAHRSSFDSGRFMSRVSRTEYLRGTVNARLVLGTPDPAPGNEPPLPTLTT